MWPIWVIVHPAEPDVGLARRSSQPQHRRACCEHATRTDLEQDERLKALPIKGAIFVSLSAVEPLKVSDESLSAVEPPKVSDETIICPHLNTQKHPGFRHEACRMRVIDKRGNGETNAAWVLARTRKIAVFGEQRQRPDVDDRKRREGGRPD